MPGFARFFLLALIACLALPAPAKAEPKPWIWSWGLTHFDNLDFVPYTEHVTQPQHAQWRRAPWTMDEWAPTRAAGQAQLDKFFRAGIFSDFDGNGDVPVLTVGKGFYHLSGYDQRRVVDLLDQQYEVTKSSPGIFMLEDGTTGKTLGVYTRLGLQLQ